MSFTDFFINDLNTFTFIIPGFLWIMFYCYLRHKPLMNMGLIVFWSLAISYCLRWISNDEILWIAIVGIISDLGLCVFLNSKIGKMCLNKLNHKSPNDDIWLDVIDYELGTKMRIFLKNSDTYLEGEFTIREEKSNDSWFVLRNYHTYKNGAEINNRDTQKKRLAVNLNTIERIELFYEDETKIFEA